MTDAYEFARATEDQHWRFERLNLSKSAPWVAYSGTPVHT